MELWIRSQNKEALIKVDKIFYWNTCPEMPNTGKHYLGNKEWVGNADYTKLGEYNTKERALEVLDEIQEKLQNKFLCKPKSIMKRKYIDMEEDMLNRKYNENFIMQPPTIDIEPIYCDIVIYEMPKE